MTTVMNDPEAVLDLFRNKGMLISIMIDNYRIQASKTWNKYMGNFGAKDKCIEPCYPNQNTFKNTQKNGRRYNK